MLFASQETGLWVLPLSTASGRSAHRRKGRCSVCPAVWLHWRHCPSSSAARHVIPDVSGAPGDVSGDAHILEAGGLLGPPTSVLGWHTDFTRGNGTSTGGSWHLIGEQHVADLKGGPPS